MVLKLIKEKYGKLVSELNKLLNSLCSFLNSKVIPIAISSLSSKYFYPVFI